MARARGAATVESTVESSRAILHVLSLSLSVEQEVVVDAVVVDAAALRLAVVVLCFFILLCLFSIGACW